MKNSTSGAMSFAAPQAHQSFASTRTSRVHEARGERGRHAVHHAAVGLAVAAGNQRRALGQRVLADAAVENELVQRRLDHRHRGRELLEVDEELLVGVRGGQERRGRPAGALVEELRDRFVALDERGHVRRDAVGVTLLDDNLGQHALQHVHRAPGDAAQVHGVEQQRAHVDVEAPESRGDLPGDVALGAAGRAPHYAGLARLDQQREGVRKLARAQRVVRGDGGGLGHGGAPNGGGTARTPSGTPEPRFGPSRPSVSCRRSGERTGRFEAGGEAAFRRPPGRRP